MQKSPESPLLDSTEQRCADCSILLATQAQVGATCSECGEPLCLDCARVRAEDGEPMLCRACWEALGISADIE
jgi:predicted RNA-binding Zn-ribbon protein involved in translation (DUF1610 family)